METPVCIVEEGLLKGQSDFDFKGTPFLSFLGIPYAKPPLGKLRFKAPQPPEKWEGVRDATKQQSPCYSFQQVLTEKSLILQRMGSEDCLHLNIYTRQLFKTNNDLKPVMVFIHGGGFVTGSSDRSFYGPEFLMSEDIVLVTINYRLGALGFLAIDDPSLGVTGNAGLKDQVQALKWVQNNIKQFCGDPNNVTIFGQSAGAASVHFLVLSPSAKGLFHRAILQSGTALCPWTRGTNSAKNVAEVLGCTEATNEKILEFLEKVPFEKILDAQTQLGDWFSPAAKRNFGPTVEETFLSEEPLDLIDSGTYNHVPLMIGYTSLEGILEAHSKEFGLEANFEDFVPYYFGFSKGSEEFDATNRKISRFYFGGDKPKSDKEEHFYLVFTDVINLLGIFLAVKAHARTCQEPVYYYRMSVDTDLNLFKKMTKAETAGVSHGDDLGYIFKTKYSNLKPDSVEELAVLRFVKMWTNFAKTGTPIPIKDAFLDTEWKPVSENVLNFLDIGTELKSGVDPDIERMKFWEKISEGVKISY